MYDTDGSGSIDFAEFMILFHIMDDGTPEEVYNQNEQYFESYQLCLQVLSRIFRVFDLNGDGFISVEEMNRIIKVSS